jgi:oligosaccharide repeat unit polymerase
MSGFKSVNNYSDYYFISYGVFICYALSPLYTISNKKLRPKMSYYKFDTNQKIIIKIAIIGGIFSIIYALPFAITSVSLGAKEVRMVILSSEDTTVLPKNFFTTIAVAFATFFSLYLGVFFLSLKSNLKLMQKILLLLASLSYVVISLCYTARDGILFFIIFGTIYITNFWSSFTDKIKKTIFLPAIIFVYLAVYFFNSFTEDRFEDSSNGTLGYIATQPFVFAENVERRNSLGNEFFYGTSLRFPLINMVLGNKIVEFPRIEQYEWTFGTFLTDFYSINGFITLIILLIIFTEFFRYQFKKARNSPLKFMLVYTFYIHFIVSGLFYFRLGTFSGNIFILIVVILILSTDSKVKKIIKTKEIPFK